MVVNHDNSCNQPSEIDCKMSYQESLKSKFYSMSWLYISSNNCGPIFATPGVPCITLQKAVKIERKRGRARGGGCLRIIYQEGILKGVKCLGISHLHQTTILNIHVHFVLALLIQAGSHVHVSCIVGRICISLVLLQ